MKRRIAIFIIFILTVLYMADSGISPAIAAEKAMSVDVQKAIERGLAAAKQEEWELAYKYFKEALEKAPFDPAVVFNYALAADKAGGRNLTSIAYYRAFLALSPDAENATTVRSRITELEISSEAEAQSIIAKAKQTMQEIPEEDRSICYSGIITALIRAKDLPQAIAVASGNKLDVYRKQYDASLIAVAQLKNGDLSAAYSTAAKLADQAPHETAAASARDYVLTSIAREQAKSNDFEGAKKTADLMKEDLNRMSAYATIAEFQLKAKDIPGAEKTTALITKNDRYLSCAHSLLSTAKAEVGDMAAAKKYIQLARDAAAKDAKTHMDPAYINEAIYEEIGIAEANMGDIQAAKKTAASIKESSYQMDINRAISNTLANSGKIEEAKSIVSGISDYYTRARAYRDIVERQIKKGDIAGAQKTADIIEAKDIKYSAQSMIELAQKRWEDAEACEIYAVVNDPAFKEMEDMPSFIQSLKAKETKWAAWYLANAATNIMLFLNQLNDIETTAQNRAK